MKLIVLGLFFESVPSFVIQRFRFNTRKNVHPRRLFSALSIDNLKIVDIESYLKFRPQLDTSRTKLMNGLAGCSVSNLSSDVDLITLSEGYLPEFTIESASQFIYARRFYPELLKKIRKHDMVVLLSNPGTGKSMFQYYYLARLMNPAAFKDPLPPDSTESSEIPEVVVRQIGVDEMEVYFIRAKVAHLVPVRKSVLRCFDPKTTLYFFEPGGSRTEPMWAGTGMTMPILSCCAPDEIRYKEFCKNGGIKLYMPLFTFSELQTIGKHMREQSNFPSNLNSLYSDEGILKSYNEYDGIIRHVLPTSLEYFKDIGRMKKSDVAKADWLQYMKCPNIERPNISDFIAKYVVCPTTFKILSYDLINEAMEKTLATCLQDWTLEELVTILKYEGYNNVIITAHRYAYEEVLSRHMTNDADYRERFLFDQRFNKNKILNYISYSPRFKRLAKEQVEFNDMEMDVLYKPKNPLFPFCDLYYKTKKDIDAPDGPSNVKLVAINTCFGESSKSKYREFNTFPTFNKIVKLPEDVHLDFKFCPHPNLADTAIVSLPKTNFPVKMTCTASIIKVPLDFSASFK